MLIEIRDVTEDSGFSQEDLAKLYDTGVRILDLETGGLKAKFDAITEISVHRVVQKESGEYRLEHFGAHLLPFKPSHKNYHESEGVYIYENHEYNIDSEALAITNTEVSRSSPDQPMAGILVDGELKEPAYAFYEIVHEFLEFVYPGRYDDEGKQKESYNPEQTPRMAGAHNAHFDMVFLAEKLIDVFDKNMELPDEIKNPANYVCTMQWYGTDNTGKKTLDAAILNKVDPNAKMRGRHAGDEDTLLTMKLELALLEEYGQILSVAELLLSQTGLDDDSLKVDKAGNVSLSFPQDEDITGEKQTRALDYFKKLAPVSRKTVSVSDDNEVTIKAGGFYPAVLTNLNNLVFFNRLQDAEVITDYSLKPASKVSLATQNGDSNDTHLGSLRYNHTLLLDDPDHIADYASFIAHAKKASKKIGLVVIESDKISLRGSKDGEIVIAIPENDPPHQHLQLIKAFVESLAETAFVPGVKKVNTSVADLFAGAVETLPALSGNPFNGEGVAGRLIEEASDSRAIILETSPILLQAFKDVFDDPMAYGITFDEVANEIHLLPNAAAVDRKIFKNVAYLLVRFENLVGTTGMELSDDGKLIVEQEHGVSDRALKLLLEAGLEFEATQTTITLSWDEISRNINDVSDAISDTRKKFKQDGWPESGPIDAVFEKLRAGKINSLKIKDKAITNVWLNQQAALESKFPTLPAKSR